MARGDRVRGPFTLYDLSKYSSAMCMSEEGLLDTYENIYKEYWRFLSGNLSQFGPFSGDEEEIQEESYCDTTLSCSANEVGTLYCAGDERQRRECEGQEEDDRELRSSRKGLTLRTVREVPDAPTIAACRGYGHDWHTSRWFPNRCELFIRSPTQQVGAKEHL
nr:hypothetical protein Iba_chr04cCG12670 [Ipomoea batatas]